MSRDGAKLAIGAIAALAAAGAAIGSVSRKTNAARGSANPGVLMAKDDLHGLANHFSNRSWRSPEDARKSIRHHLTTNWMAGPVKFYQSPIDDPEVVAWAQAVPLYERGGEWKIGDKKDAAAKQQTALTVSAPPITMQSLEKRGRLVKPKDFTKEKIEGLIEEIEDEYGKYGRRNNSFEFNIKTSIDVPGWVDNLLGDDVVADLIFDEARSNIESLIERIKDEDDSLYQSWFNGEWSIAGRSGGYLLLGVNPLVSDLRDAIVLLEEGEVVTIVPSGRRYFANTDESMDARNYVNEATLALEQRSRLETFIRDVLKSYNKTLSSDSFWADAVEGMGHSEEEIQAAKEGRVKRRQRPVWDSFDAEDEDDMG
jgi:hypothetical protein